MNATICDEVPADLTPVKTYAVTGVVEAVTCAQPTVYPAEGEERLRVSLIDYGAKRNITRELQKRGCTVTVLPATVSAEEVLEAHPDGIMLSNGPGDPASAPISPARTTATPWTARASRQAPSALSTPTTGPARASTIRAFRPSPSSSIPRPAPGPRTRDFSLTGLWK